MKYIIIICISALAFCTTHAMDKKKFDRSAFNNVENQDPQTALLKLMNGNALHNLERLSEDQLQVIRQLLIKQEKNRR